ncbi:unnamed protein product [Cladocopium goreaui]|uniref:RNase H type-1 domain-containing protein n=1 Tax=Cladocopium goreaui TaxID=2562237 RepID=A0A9P1GR69_9DINO|nr:unnamed protein product [Cladocopium goreaui]|mmetsp:Transcript_4857/g.11136  ORF Transcript_4857/g.11136 Transcript_4857/m.11136 type:complete len:235 (+) Transcript_4857:64-768(+)
MRRPEGPGRQREHPPLVLDRAVASSVSLQIFLYCGVWFDLFFALVEVFAGWAKLRWIQGTVMTALLCANYVLCFLLEPCRLYLGYAGNLGEKVPELFLFVFLCLGCIAILVAQLAMGSFLEDLQPGICSLAPELPCIFTIEQACWIIRLALSLGELLLGVRALRKLIHEQSARFFVALDTEGAPFDDIAPWATDRSRPNLTGRNNLERTQPEDRQGPLAQVYGRPASPQRLHAD